MMNSRTTCAIFAWNVFVCVGCNSIHEADLAQYCMAVDHSRADLKVLQNLSTGNLEQATWWMQVEVLTTVSQVASGDRCTGIPEQWRADAHQWGRDVLDYLESNAGTIDPKMVKRTHCLEWLPQILESPADKARLQKVKEGIERRASNHTSESVRPSAEEAPGPSL